MTEMLGTPLPPAKCFKKVIIAKARKVPKSTIDGFVFAKLLLNPPSPLGLLRKLPRRQSFAELKKKKWL